MIGPAANAMIRALSGLAEAGEEVLGDVPGGSRKTTLNSSMLSSAEYDGGTLTLTFRGSGESYAYHGVPAVIYEGLISAPSAGRYFNATIKGRY